MQTNFDVVVIGGGPAGMMAAARASARGRQTLLLEKNPILGKKLSITGGGRCNVTNNKPVVREMLSQYKESGKFLFSTFMQHGVVETILWFKERGVELVEENEGRLFPSTHQAETICDVLRNEVLEKGVIVKNNISVTGIIHKDKVNGEAREDTLGYGEFEISTSEGIFIAKSCVVATGGTSRPETGSTGEGFLWLQSLGHTVTPNNMALVPLAVKDKWIARLSGITLPAVKLTLFADGVKHSAHKGKILFTHFGVTGPTILNLSKTVSELLERGMVTIKVDLLPDLDEGMLKEKIQNLISESPNKKIKNILAELLPMTLVEIILEICGLNGETIAQVVDREAKVRLLNTLKALPLQIDSLLGEDKAIVSAGGVVLEEIDFKTMQSRIVPNLYLIGDVLNINRPSGGYSLQICWSTGFVAGENA